MYALSQEVLRTDVSGMPLEWIDYRDAVRLHFMGQVAYTFGQTLFALRGGVNARTGNRTEVQVSSIVATTGHSHNPGNRHHGYVPPLNNETLFRRDAHLCLYCGERFPTSQLSRDHVTPLSRGGHDTWNNVVTACRRCNNLKAWRTPEQAQLQLIAVPFTPSYAEYIYLKGRRVLADQMEYLLAPFPAFQPAACTPESDAKTQLNDAVLALRAPRKTQWPHVSGSGSRKFRGGPWGRLHPVAPSARERK
jgi:hypothetical protein